MVLRRLPQSLQQRPSKYILPFDSHLSMRRAQLTRRDHEVKAPPLAPHAEVMA